MKLRASHVVVLVLLGIGTLVLFVVLRPSSAGQKESGDFLEQARAWQESDVGTKSVAGGVPPVTEDPSVSARLEVETTEFDMGVISNAEPTTKELKVRNTGKRDLKITTIKTTCGCTLGTFNRNSKRPGYDENAVIPPGGEMPMYVTVNPFRVPGFYSHKTLTIYSSDVVNPTLEVQVYAHIDPEFILEPDSLDFGTIEYGSSATKEVRIRQAGTKPLKLEKVETPSPRGRRDLRDTVKKEDEPFAVALQDVPENEWKEPGHREWKVAVTLSPNLPLGVFQNQFYIYSDAKRVSKFYYTMKADVKTFFRVEPALIRVRDKVTAGQEKIATATILSEQPFELEDLSISGKDLSLSTRPGETPNTVFVDVNVAPDAKPGFKTETITMKIKSGDKSVPYSTRALVTVM